MSILILFAIALCTLVALWWQLDALILVVAPLVGLFFLLSLAPTLIETMEKERKQ